MKKICDCCGTISDVKKHATKCPVKKCKGNLTPIVKDSQKKRKIPKRKKKNRSQKTKQNHGMHKRLRRE